MKRLRGVALGLAAAGIGLTVAASATGKAANNRVKTRQVQSRIEALATDGNRIAYDVGSTLGKNNNRVFVWNVRTGKTTAVSGTRTARMDDSSTGSGVFQLAIAGTRVAWMANVGGNSEGDDYLFTSSVTKPKERQLATVQRSGDNCPGRRDLCAGPWLGGLVGSGSLIALNRWTTDVFDTVTGGELDVLSGTKLKRIATGADTVLAASADGGRVAVLRSDGTIGLYSSAGNLLRMVTPSGFPAASVAWSGHNLVVMQSCKLELYYSPSGSPVKSFPVLGTCGQHFGNLDVQGNIAIYSMAGSLHALDLGNGRNRIVAKLGGNRGTASISSAGLAYDKRLGSNEKLVFVPFARVVAAVS